MSPVAVLGPLLVTARVNCIGSPISTSGSSTVLTRERSAAGTRRSVSVELSSAGSGSVTPAPGRRLAVLTRSPVADGSMSAARAKTTSPPAGSEASSPARPPDPEAAQLPPRLPWQAQVAERISAGRVSVICGRRGVGGTGVGHRDQVDRRGPRHGLGDAVGLGHRQIGDRRERVDVGGARVADVRRAGRHGDRHGVDQLPGRRRVDGSEDGVGERPADRDVHRIHDVRARRRRRSSPDRPARAPRRRRRARRAA